MKYLVANWKSNKTIAEANEWLLQITNYTFPRNPAKRALQITNLEIIIAASFIHLPILKNSSISLAAQNISPFSSGAYTGEISAEMLQHLVDYVIIGHSERRQYFKETDELVAKKAVLALKHNITPIVCLDEPYIESQIASLLSYSATQLLFAYEPLAAISSGQADTPEHADKVAQKIKSLTNQAPVFYGGSVNDENAPKFMAEANIDGLLVGRKSLEAREFVEIIKSLQ